MYGRTGRKSSLLRMLPTLFGVGFLLLVADASRIAKRSDSDAASLYSYSSMDLALSHVQHDDETMEGRTIYKNPRNAPSHDCPRDEDAARRMGRTCLRKCSSGSDCLSRKKVCLCDGICGMSCIKPDKECGELVNPMFGFVEVNGRVVGSRARYKCQKGYHLIGTEERVCQADGTWSRTPPECKENLYCIDPPSIAHAKHDAVDSKARFEVNHTLQYSCDEGYEETTGFYAAKCFLYNGTMQWFGPEINCKARSCGDPGDIEHGFKEGPCYSFSCKINYFCEEGFEIVGKRDHYCQPDGTWSPRELPTCKAVECETPDNPDNGKVIYTTQSYNSVVTYECNYGHMIFGSPTRRCESDKQWSGQRPQCKEINCGNPGELPNGRLQGLEDGTALEATVIFRCHAHMTMEGHSSTTCMENGKWSFSLPKCLAPCIVPAIENGSVNNTKPREKVPHGFQLNVTCNENYELEHGGASPSCYNGTWSRYPNCEPAKCKELPRSPRNGMVIAPKSDHGQMAKYDCRDGFKLEGRATTICRYGNWTGILPRCKEIYCPFPGTIKNGRVMLVGNMGEYDYREYVLKVRNNRQIRYKCEKGFYRVKGPPGATCVAGRWSPNNRPKCIPDLHPRLKWIKKRRKRSITQNTSKLPLTNELSSDEHHDKITTKQNEEAKIEEFKPRINYLNPVVWHMSRSSLKKGIPQQGDDTNHGASHFSDVDSKSQKNLDSSEEDLSEFTLRRVERSPQEFDKEERKRMRLELRKKRRRNKRKKGLRGRIFAHCEELTTESHVNIDIIQPGRDENYTYSSGARVRVFCSKGYGLNIGNRTAKCARGRWKPVKPQCFNLPCPLPHTEHGEFEYNEMRKPYGVAINHGEVVKFSCDHGYTVHGTDTMRCWYGKWAVTGRMPECHPDSCILPSITHGRYKTGYKQNLTVLDNSEVEFHCDSEYSKNAPEIHCQLGQLMPTSPACIATSNAVFKSIDIKKSEALIATPKQMDSRDVRIYREEEPPTKIITALGLISEKRVCNQPEIFNGSLMLINTEPFNNATLTYIEGTNVTYTCVNASKNATWSLTCGGGLWIGQNNSCEPEDFGEENCVWIKEDDIVLTFWNDIELTQDKVNVPAGAKLESRCNDIGKYAMSGNVTRRCKFGKLTGEAPRCFGLSQLQNFSLEVPPTILFRHMKGPIAQTNEGTLLVYPGTVLHIECLWKRQFGTPRWNVSQTVTEFGRKKKRRKKKPKKTGKNRGLMIDRKHPEGWTTDPSRNRQLEYRLSLYKAKKDDSGSYICTTPLGYKHAVKVDVKAVHCPLILKSLGLIMEPNSTKMSTKADFSCDAGNTLVGLTQIRCKPSGNWSAPAPHCEKVRCSRPTPPKNGRIEGEGPFRVGDIVQVTCLPTFMMEGHPMMACTKDGTWTGEVPKCVVACTYPGTIISGRMSSIKFYYPVGDTITYTCSDGFSLHGDREIECLDGVRWSASVPSCLPNQ